MIDARDHLGTPVVTNCPTYVERDGVRYEVAADAFVLRESDLRTQWVDEKNEFLTSWQRTYLAHTVRTPHAFFSMTNA